MTFDDYIIATSEPGTDLYRVDPDPGDPSDAQARIADWNARTQRLRPTGDAHRDRLVAAKLHVRQTQEGQ